jgi:uncharacterized protein (TIGR00369 family)
MDNINERTRSITWEDPMIGISQAGSFSGIEYLQAMMRGEFPPPPIAETLNFRLVEVSEGRALFTVEPQEYHYNPIGMVHGGLTCTLLDSAMGCAVQTMLPAGVLYTTLDINVNFIRPLSHQTGLVRCEGEVIHVGRSTATAQARMIDANGKLYAHGSTTCMIFRPGE